MIRISENTAKIAITDSVAYLKNCQVETLHAHYLLQSISNVSPNFFNLIMGYYNVDSEEARAAIGKLILDDATALDHDPHYRPAYDCTDHLSLMRNADLCFLTYVCLKSLMDVSPFNTSLLTKTSLMDLLIPDTIEGFQIDIEHASSSTLESAFERDLSVLGYQPPKIDPSPAISTPEKAIETLGGHSCLNTGVDAKAPIGSGITHLADLEGLSDYLLNYSDLTDASDIDPAVERDKEVDRMIQIMSCRVKNNPLIVGDHGVGRTSLVAAFAARVARKAVPPHLDGCPIYALDVGKVKSNLGSALDYEKRLQKIVEVIMTRGAGILFIDDIGDILSGTKGLSADDIGTILRPILKSEKIYCVATCLPEDHASVIEPKPSYAQYFQPLTLAAPTQGQAIKMAQACRHTFELHHGVSISDEAIEAAVRLSDRYVTSRHLPSKAFDLIDEACALLRAREIARPDGLDEAEEELYCLNHALKVSARAAIADNDETVSREKIAALTEQVKKLRSIWDDCRSYYQNMMKLTDEIKAAKSEEAVAVKNGLIDDAERLGEKIAHLDHVRGIIQEDIDDSTAGHHTVLPKHIAQMVADWTGIPVSKMSGDDIERLRNMEKELNKKVIGQSAATKSVSSAVRRARTGMADPDRPTGSFLFMGPTGVGKTELCKALAKYMFSDKDALVRFDMSEYMEAHSVSRLIGSPPGYVGHDDGGELTDAVKNRPYAVVLFDEVEKAHPDIFNLLLQVLDDGHLTDSKGRRVDFSNSLIILTSNLGAHDPDNALDHVKAHFRPEFLNRLDDIVAFKRLSREDIDAIVGIQLCGLDKLLAARDLKMEIDDAARTWLADKGFDPDYGARPLKRVIEQQLKDRLSDLILDEDLVPGMTVHVTVNEGALGFTCRSEN